MENLEALHAELQRYEASITPQTPIDQLQADMARHARMLAEIEDGIAMWRIQRQKESELGKFIEHLEARTKDIRDQAKILEGDQLSHEAQRIYSHAQELEEKLGELKKKLFEDRKQELPALRKEAEGIDREVAALDDEFSQFLAGLESEDIRAVEEDRLPPEVKRLLLLKRIADFYMSRGLSEYTSLRKRGRYFDQAARALRDISEEEYTVWAQGWDKKKAKAFTESVKQMKMEIRERSREVHHCMSEGIQDKGTTGDELSIVSSLREQWNAKNPQEFYHRLWTLHMFLSNEHADKRLLAKVRSLLTFITRQSPDVGSDLHYKANEARRFLLRAGNGVIRNFLAERFGGLETEDDYANLGRALHDSNRPFGLLQLAVNIPRLYDLSLSTRFGRVTDKRIRRKRTNEVTMYPEMETTDSPEDLPDVPPDEFYPGWPQRLAEGDLAVTRHEDQTVEEEEVGIERQMEAQEYLLDVSPSMYRDYSRGYAGAPNQRWLFRNAIFLAALNSYSVDATTRGVKDFPNMLFLRVFGNTIDDLKVVRNQDEALQFLNVFLSYNEEFDGTNIQGVLNAAFEDIENAKGATRALREAKIVVVTDGESDLNLGSLLKRKGEVEEKKGARIVTHVFAVEIQKVNESGRKKIHPLEELSRASGPGKAFYYFVEDAGDEKLIDLPPYGTKDEFSSVYPEPSFANEAERVRFEKEVTRQCDEIAELARQSRTRQEEDERDLAEDMDNLFGQPLMRAPAGSWDEKMIRKSRRVIDIFAVFSPEATAEAKATAKAEAKAKATAEGKTEIEAEIEAEAKVKVMYDYTGLMDDYTSPGEAAALLRRVLRQRAVLKQELRDVVIAPLTDESIVAVEKYREEAYPKLNRR